MQFITVGFAVTPLYFIWEKLLGIHHTKRFLWRAICRVPVMLPIWFLAIAFPFFGPINSAAGALLVTFTVYIIPCLAHMVYFRAASTRVVCFLIFIFSFLLTQINNIRSHLEPMLFTCFS